MTGNTIVRDDNTVIRITDHIPQPRPKGFLEILTPIF